MNSISVYLSGVCSVLEAVWSEVPLLGIPFVMDQHEVFD